MIGRGEIADSELWEILLGLRLALELGHRRMVVEMNCMEATSLISKGTSALHRLFGLVEDIRNLLNQMKSWEVNHVYRQQNRVAHMLTLSGFDADLSCFYFSQQPPPPPSTMF